MSQPAGACCYASATDVLRLQSKKTLVNIGLLGLGNDFHPLRGGSVAPLIPPRSTSNF